MIAHVILAILLASAMAATFVGRRASNAVSQGRLCTVDFGIADHGERAGREQAAEIGSPRLLILPSLSLPPLSSAWDEPNPGREVAP